MSDVTYNSQVFLFVYLLPYMYLELFLVFQSTNINVITTDIGLTAKRVGVIYSRTVH